MRERVLSKKVTWYILQRFFCQLYDKYCLGEAERKLGRSLVAVVVVKKCVDGSLFSDV